MQDQAKREGNLYTPPHAPADAQPNQRGGPPSLRKGNKSNRKVVITIKQQAPDGSMVSIPQGALSQLAAAQAMPSAAAPNN